MNAGESDSLMQLVGSAPQQAGRATAVEGMAEASAPVQGLHYHADDHLNPSAQWWVEEAHLLPPQTEGHQTLMSTPL